VARIQSILAVECGNVTTRAILIEQVKGRYRLIASGQTASTYGSPQQDITVGVVTAVRQIEQAVRRVLLAPGGWPLTPQNNKQQGVDAYITVCSAGEPLQLALMGLTTDLSIASAQLAASQTYTDIASLITLDNPPQFPGKGKLPYPAFSPEARIFALQNSPSDVIMLVGGMENGAEAAMLSMINSVALAIRTGKGKTVPHILYAGNSALRNKVTEILGPLATWNAVENIRPAFAVENISPAHQALESLFVQRKLFQLSGFQKLSNWSKQPITPAYKSFEKVITYLSRQNGQNVLGVNVGSRTTVVSACGHNFQETTVKGNVGVGHSIMTMLKAGRLSNILRWLPYPVEPKNLYNQLLNKTLYPGSIPVDNRDLLLEQAAAKECIKMAGRHILGKRPHASWNLIIGAGQTLIDTPHPGHAVLTLLDSLEPWGITSLALDIGQATGMLGAIAPVQPEAAVMVTARDTFLNLGTIIAPRGRGVVGKPALKIKLQYASAMDGAPPFNIDVAGGELRTIPLSPGQKATLEITPTRNFDIGGGQPGQGITTDIEGGILGVIIDTRGRPLILPQDDDARQELLEKWIYALAPQIISSPESMEIGE
jgi:hypothetical protein